MTTELEMFLNTLKATVLDERKCALEEQHYVCGRLSALNRICECIEKYQQDHKNSENNIAKTTNTANRVKLRDNPYNRERRPMMKTVIVDGTGYSFKNAKEMLRTFGVMDYYKTFCHLVQYKGGRKNIVKMEADALRRLLIHQGKHLDSYTSHGFSGLIKTITFDNEKEEENA